MNHSTSVAPSAAFTEKQVEADGFTIRYLEAGAGDPLVYIHGASGVRLSKAHDILAESYRVIAIEVPGFGDSPANEKSATMADLAATLCTAVANLGIRYHIHGRYDLAVPLMRQAIELSVSPPPFYFHVLAADHLIKQEWDDMLSAAQRASLDGWSFGQAMLAIAHNELSHGRAAAAALGKLAELDPVLSETPRVWLDSHQASPALLEAIVFPSATFARGYEPLTIFTRDGEVHGGVIRRQSLEAIYLVNARHTSQRIDRSEIDSMTPSRISVMPQGFAKILSPEQLADLVAYLKTLQ